ncbi:AraC family transcriptional regulator [Modestobacter sp. I12A-02662]|uniref:AraC family transcriptional regulator n=1 Tax=Modestobacter sp. I12A-02662 TaxID=1730496 RepID=UPI0034DE09F1
MDVLSSVLRELRLESASYRRLELRAPWRLRFDGGLRGVHVLVRGACSITLDEGPPRLLEAGDLVVLPRAGAHQMSSVGDERGPATSALDLARRTTGSELQAGGGGAGTTVLCGAFFLGDEGHPAIAGLPRFIHVPAQGGQSPPWLAGLTGALAAETVDGGPGSDVVMARLSDALVTRALRYHVEEGGDRGWLRGLHDPWVARALTALHEDLAAPWTVASLAVTSGLSRSAFAARFADTMGQSPMQYLTHCRMRRAMTLLRTERMTLASVAARIGYGSEAALSAAFVRYTGVPPGTYRRSLPAIETDVPQAQSSH